MKSLMKIYIKYIATAILLIFAFVLLQLGLLGVITVKLYGSGSDYGKYSIRLAYDRLLFTDGVMDARQVEAASYLEDMDAAFVMLLDQTGKPVWTYCLPEHLNHTIHPRKSSPSHAGIWTIIRYRCVAETRDSL